MQGIIQWIVDNGAMVLGVLFAISEALAAIPSVKANSVFQAIAGAIKWLKEKFAPAKAA